MTADLSYLLERLPDWHVHAECRGMDPNLFFPQRGASTRLAKAACARCRVQAECLDYALDHPPGEILGIWGGTSKRERRDLRRERKVPAGKKKCSHCDVVKPLSEFHRNATQKSGRSSRCADCHNVSRRNARTGWRGPTARVSKDVR